jgi:hypothetical protein
MLYGMEHKTQTPQTSEPLSTVPPASPQRKKIGLIIISVVLLLGIAAALFLFFGKNGQPVYNPPADQGSDPFMQQYVQNCRDRAVTFTHSPIPPDQLAFMEPMGKVSDGHVTPTDHVYLTPKVMTAADNTTDVVMPADGTVTMVAAMPAQYIGDNTQQTAPEDHRIAITHNCEYVSIFIHVHQLSEPLQKALGEKLQPNTQKQVSVSLQAGDVIGKIGANPVDWSLMDASKTLDGFVTPKLYEGEPWKIHVIDPVSVYSGAVKDQLIAKSLRDTEPYGGKIDYDKKGAVVGNWFKEGTNGYQGASQDRYWDGHLSIAPNYVDPTSTTVSIGNWQGKATQFSAKTGPDPASVTQATGPVRYELVGQGLIAPNGQPWSGRELVKGLKANKDGAIKGVIMVQVMSGEKLKVELFPGKTANQVSDFTQSAQTYVR